MKTLNPKPQSSLKIQVLGGPIIKEPLTIRMDFGEVYYTITIVRNPQNGIGNYQGSYIKVLRRSARQVSGLGWFRVTGLRPGAGV